jgi:hypothetical protein
LVISDEEDKIDNKKKQKTLQLEKRTTTSYKVPRIHAMQIANTDELLFDEDPVLEKCHQYYAVLWIQIRIGSGFNGVPGSGFVIRIQED